MSYGQVFWKFSPSKNECYHQTCRIDLDVCLKGTSIGGKSLVPRNVVPWMFFFNVNGPYTSKKWMFPNQELDNRDVHWTESKMAFRSLFLHLILRPYQISHWDRSRNWVPHSIFWKSSDINYYYWKLLIK